MQQKKNDDQTNHYPQLQYKVKCFIKTVLKYQYQTTTNKNKLQLQSLNNHISHSNNHNQQPNQNQQPIIINNTNININNQHRVTIWQKFIYSIKKYSQDPFDIGGNLIIKIFQCMFVNNFYIKQIKQLQHSQEYQLEEYNWQQKNYQQGGNYGGNQQNRTNLTRNYNKESNYNKQNKYNTQSKSNNRQTKPSRKQLYQIINKNDIDKWNVPIMTLQQRTAIINLIKSTKQLLTFQYIANMFWYIVLVFCRKNNSKVQKNIEYHLLQQFQVLKQNNTLTSLDQKIIRHLNYALLANSIFAFIQIQKINTLKLFNLCVRAFSFSKLYNQNIDMRIYMHTIHKAAQKQKKHLLAQIIRSGTLSVEQYSQGKNISGYFQKNNQFYFFDQCI